ncbi:hypothetical protein K1719_043702 [Acacia pycnantha]|nr:hypothetical protein K1719_043702 [Acacia pycnantha]
MGKFLELFANCSCEIYEPSCKRIEGEDEVVFHIDVKGYRKSQLHMKTEWPGRLKIWGEKRVGEMSLSSAKLIITIKKQGAVWSVLKNRISTLKKESNSMLKAHGNSAYRASANKPYPEVQSDDHYDDEKPCEECGVVGIYGDPKASRLCYLALHALQHRGQEDAGIVAANKNMLHSITGIGLVSDVFNESKLDQLPGNLAIGHVRYSTAGQAMLKNVQPFVAGYRFGSVGVAHNVLFVATTPSRACLAALSRASAAARSALTRASTSALVAVALSHASLSFDSEFDLSLASVTALSTLSFASAAALSWASACALSTTIEMLT